MQSRFRRSVVLAWGVALISLSTVSAAQEPDPSARARFEPIEQAEPPAALPPPEAPPSSAPAPSWSPPPDQPARTAAPVWQMPPQADRPARKRDTSDEWLLSAEGVTHAPVDIGFQFGVEMPFGGRLFAGYGWVPEPYLDVIIDAATAASEDTGVRAVVSNTFDSGTAWRVQGGVRPFRKLGLYLDGGYSQVRLDGSLAAADIAAVGGVPVSAIGSDGYAVRSTIHMWLVELGYQAVVADHIVLGAGAGMMGTIDASTEATPSFDSLGAEERVLRDLAIDVVDQQIESYGFVPTITVRLGVDLI